MDFGKVGSGEVFLALVLAGALRAVDFESFFFDLAFFADLLDLDFFEVFLVFAIALLLIEADVPLEDQLR